tara:strand:- start:14 stop:229 length:216 start_codon:yes stop_codon:yes gene_type:complete
MTFVTKTQEYNEYHKTYRAKNIEKTRAYNNAYQKDYLKNEENKVKRREMMKIYMRKYRANKRKKAESEKNV